jgi:hypothetical protein
MEVTESLIAGIPVGNLRVPRSDFAAVWASSTTGHSPADLGAHAAVVTACATTGTVALDSSSDQGRYAITLVPDGSVELTDCPDNRPAAAGGAHQCPAPQDRTCPDCNSAEGTEGAEGRFCGQLGPSRRPVDGIPRFQSAAAAARIGEVSGCRVGDLDTERWLDSQAPDDDIPGRTRGQGGQGQARTPSPPDPGDPPDD